MDIVFNHQTGLKENFHYQPEMVINTNLMIKKNHLNLNMPANKINLKLTITMIKNKIKKILRIKLI
jgi:hypothetical protein